ncbi:mediator of RNA polymerase II transcription subunit 26 [Drosophila navojoa]|uniref:mediator of RNA polymerase II transcription subunit 26 n=1 Tax=Drosophila navojoa TaxID=7232 RepID=UPI000846543E|nr:mediator of RNA polymerase II transcription subunit 26 [Drosophila navojoa]
MNQTQIQQLTSHLSQALDQNYDVVNMETVLSVICALEGTTITKEQLEATRLAKYINQLRRRTKNDQLARRAKSLLKKWREMVGIHQQTSIDSQSQHVDQSTYKPMVETNLTESESNTTEAGFNPPQPFSPTLQRVISHLHSNIDSSEPKLDHQTNLSSLINNNINNDNSEESLTIVNKLFIQQPKSSEFKTQKSSTIISEHVANDKLNQASIVIDIVSDSDENDATNSQKKLERESLATSSHYFRPKKLKKDKKGKDRDSRDKPSLFNLKGETSQQSRNSKKSNLHRSLKESKTPKVYSADPEILSLSNSSMSSILSGDAVSGNFQTRPHPSAADLTFAGRFKSAGRLETFSNINSLQANGQKSTASAIDTSSEVPTRPICEENNDSNTSCSRLSPYDELEPKFDQIRLKSCEERIPKKRGRKKGSKGVDSLIAKESSLSQQIFFGSGVKKVKTTKELFNEIQSRKLSTSFNRSENTITAPSVTNRVLNTSSTNVRNSDCRFLHTRPASSCSETSIHSPHALEPFSSNVSLAGTEKHSNTLEDPGNTDSDTVTSEHSRDSKPRNMRIHSLDSNSNLHQHASSAKNGEDIELKTDYNDVRTQLMHIVRSLSSPLTVDETEKRYQAEIVPCTCIIFEDMPNESYEHKKLSEIDRESDLVKKGSFDIDISRDNEQTALKTENCVVDAAEQTIAKKPMKSIFDLDFDDDDDPLLTIIKHVLPTESSVKTKLDFDVNLTESNVSLAEEDINKDMKAAITDSLSADQESSNIIAEPISIYTVREDPKCIARQRFDVQTNDVTNFHINALHNYYIPNINGNWNSIDSSLVSLSVTEFLQTLESYTVTDGSDVVPKYGSLTYEQRIRKDLSYLKFVQNSKSKSFKSVIPPFLGVAKCLPTCRLAAKRLKDKTKSLPTINSANKLGKQEKSEMNCISSGPNLLRVDVTINDTQKNNESQVRHSDDDLIKRNAALSYNLLKVVTDNGENPENLQKSDDLNIECTNMKFRRYKSRSSNLQLTQDSLNEKLRNQKAEDTEKSEWSESNIERNRKKRRKTYNSTHYDKHNINNLTIDEKPRIKRIKIAIHGNVATHSQVSMISGGDISSGDEEGAHIEISDMEVGYDTIGYSQCAQAASDDDHGSNRSHSTTVDSLLADDDHMENDDDNNGDDEEYAIVQRPLAQGCASNNHIVLTIKKTPSKINSPANSISAISPIVGVVAEGEMSTGKQQDAEIIASFLSIEPKAETHGSESIPMPDTCCNNLEKCYRYSHRRRVRHRQQICQKETIDIELNHLFNNVRRSAQPLVKTHQKLFFTNELCRQDKSGRNERIINYSSSSSSSSSSSNEDYSETEESNYNPRQTDQCSVDPLNNYKLKNETGPITSVKCIIAKQDADHRDDLYFYSSDESSIDDEHNDNKEGLNDIKLNTLSELPLENNGMLPSFNSIGATNHPQPKLTTIADLNCNDGNLCYNNTNDNLSVIQSHDFDGVRDASKMNNVINSENSNGMMKSTENYNQILSPQTMEYRSGIRSVVDDSSSRVQQFKEWHQVLQLQSYNNEPLIVLPYVVLE